MQATQSADLSQAETDQFTLLQLSLQLFCLVVNLWCNLALKERVTTKEADCELEGKQGGKGEAELLLKESSATASLISKCYQLQL